MRAAAIASTTSAKWQEARTTPRKDPLAIDLNGNGIQTVGIPATGTPILFDHNADGIKTGTGWLAPDDAWLVLDRDGNGTIDSGRELFGADTMITATETVALPGGSFSCEVTRNARSGFEALASLDANQDGLFDAQDAAFTQVRLWQDKNQDGISQAGELSTLADQGITAISLTANETTVNLGNGNTLTGQATVYRNVAASTEIDSLDLQAGNLNLANNPFYRQFTDSIPLTDAARALPAMGGSGWLRDLGEAMSLGSAPAQALTQSVTGFQGGTTRDQQQAIVDTLIDQWAQTSGKVDEREFRPVSRTVVSENSTNRTVRIAAMDPADYLDPASHLIPVSQFVLPEAYYDTVVQEGLTHKVINAEGRELLRRLADLEAFNGSRFVDFTVTEAVLPPPPAAGGSGGSGGSSAAGPTSGYQVRYQISLAPEQVVALNASYDALRESVYSALAIQTRLKPYFDAVNLMIDEQGLRFDSANLAVQLEARRVTDPRNALIDLVDLNRYSHATLQAVGFDGMGLLRHWIEALPADSPLQADLSALRVLSAADGTSVGTAHDDIYFGDANANNFHGGEGNDLIDGGAGDDQLYGEAGDDEMAGGAGNDELVGGAGSDTYRWGRGAGQDTVYNRDESPNHWTWSRSSEPPPTR